jgi:hypothetical protein
MYLQDMAEADAAKELVGGVQEYYADFMALDAHHFVVPAAGAELLINPRAIASTGTATECGARGAVGPATACCVHADRPPLQALADLH